MRKRIAPLHLDFGSIVGVVLVGLHRRFGLSKFNHCFTDYSPAVEGDPLRIYQTLYFQSPDSVLDPRSVKLVMDFLIDPGRAREHALDGPKCALVAKFVLDCFIPPVSVHKFVG